MRACGTVRRALIETAVIGTSVRCAKHPGPGHKVRRPCRALLRSCRRARRCRPEVHRFQFVSRRHLRRRRRRCSSTSQSKSHGHASDVRSLIMPVVQSARFAAPSSRSSPLPRSSVFGPTSETSEETTSLRWIHEMSCLHFNLF